MKKIMICLVIGYFFIAGPVSAQSGTETVVAGRAEALRKAMLTPDKPVLEKLVEDGLSYGHSTGIVEDKQAFLDDLLQGKTVFKTIDISDQTIKISDDIAIVRCRFVAELVDHQSPLKVDIRILQIWHFKNGEWRLLARQGFRLPAEAK